MLIIPVKDENIERALKRYKNKFRKVQITKELRKRRYYTKPTTANREEMLKAEYRNNKLRDMDA